MISRGDVTRVRTRTRELLVCPQQPWTATREIHAPPYYRKIGRNTFDPCLWSGRGKRIPRFFGEIPAWPPRWDPSGRDAYVPVEASGVLRRLGAELSR